MPSRVIIKGLNKFGTREVKEIKSLSERQVEILAKETEVIIKQKIKASLQRPGSTGKLADSFFAQKVDRTSWGVGHIPTLNAQAPYWRWINYGVAGTGRRIPPKTVGSFNPGDPAPNRSSFRAGRFTHNTDGFFLQPKRPIQPHNYIARTIREVPNLISSVLKRTKR